MGIVGNFVSFWKEVNKLHKEAIEGMLNCLKTCKKCKREYACIQRIEIEALIPKIIKFAKKEVFDDLDKCTVQGVPLFHDDCNCEWCQIKKKHLNTQDTDSKNKEGDKIGKKRK